MTQPPLAVTQPDGSRKYVHPVLGEAVPSVTSILKVIAKPRVARWAERKNAEFAVLHMDEMDGLSTAEKVDRIRSESERISQDARDLGTAVHETIEAWIKGEVREITKGTNSYLDQAVRFLFDSQPRFLFTEATVWSHAHGYAGTLDFIAEIDDHIVLADIKTGKGVYGEAALQLAALAGADAIIHEDGTEEEIPEVEELEVLHLRPRGWRLLRVDRREENFKAFLCAREILRWQEEVAPYVLEAA